MANNCCYFEGNCVNGVPNDQCTAKCDGVTQTCDNVKAEGQPCICKPKLPCDSNPCKNGGTCTNNGETFTCDCTGGWTGNTCETKLCGGKTCPSHSTCVDNACKCDLCFTDSSLSFTDTPSSIQTISISDGKLNITYTGGSPAPSPASSCKPITPTCSQSCPVGKTCLCDPTTGTSSCMEHNKVMQGYLCGKKVNPEDTDITADQIYNSGFNYILLCFFSISADPTNGIKITGNKCCKNIEGSQYRELANQLIDKGVNIGISIGGDGCKGHDDSISTATDEQIIAAFDKLREDLGIQFTGIDFDMEQCRSGTCITYIDKIGKALFNNNKDYFVTLVPMSSQFTPQGYSNSLWSVELTPKYYKHVMIQWYQGGCLGTQSCPCWGDSDIIKDSCPSNPTSWTESSIGLDLKCGVVDWIRAFSNGGNKSSSQWTSDKIVIGTKSWCGSTSPIKCSSTTNVTDTGIWSADQILKIIDALDGKIGGVGLWDVNDYYSPGYGYKNTNNPVTNECDFANIVANKLGIKNSTSTKKCDYKSICHL